MTKISAYLAEEIIIGERRILVVDGTFSCVTFKAKFSLYTASTSHIKIATKINDSSFATHNNNVCLPTSYQFISFPNKFNFNICATFKVYYTLPVCRVSMEGIADQLPNRQRLGERRFGQMLLRFAARSVLQTTQYGCIISSKKVHIL